MKNWQIKIWLWLVALGFILSPIPGGGYIAGLLVGYTLGADRLIKPFHKRPPVVKE